MKKYLLLLLPLMVAMFAACSEMDQIDREIARINKLCPWSIGHGVEITEIIRTDAELVYVCTIDESVLGDDAIDRMEASASDVRKEIRGTVDTDKNMRKLAKLLLKNNMSLVYEYKGSTTGKSMRIEFTPANFRAMNL
ncbi:MAG: hypothetical protein ACI4AM_04855 [Muribaculaceae bacterium]